MDVRLAIQDGQDAARFCELFNSLYSRKVSPEYYRWQFFASPFPSSLVVVTTAHGAFAGCYGFHVIDLDNSGTCAAWAVDIMVAPEFQGKGVFRSMAEYAAATALEHNPVALCVVANKRGCSAHVDGLGWRRIKTFSTFASSTYPYERSTDLRFSHLSPTATDSSPWEPRHADVDLVSNLRSADFCDWRFARNPWYRYDTFAVVQEQQVGRLTLKVFREPDTGQLFGDIVDIRWLSPDRQLLAEMLRFSLGYFHALGVPTATTWLQASPELERVGRDAGFNETRQERYFCVRILDNRWSHLWDPNRWFLTMADSEVY